MASLDHNLSAYAAGHSMSEGQAASAFEVILAGRAGDDELRALLGAINQRGATVDELVGATRVIRRHATPVERPTCGVFAAAKLLDTCGTGGAPKLFNVSTLAAIIAAAAGDGKVMVAKHGNVSRTGRGSAELMQALGVRIDAPSRVQSRCLSELGVCFSLAPAHHPAVRHASAVRKSMGVPTIFNLLGPLANPAGAERQMMGTWSHGHAGLLAEALARLGSERAIVYSSRDGLDELTTTEVNVVNEVVEGRVMQFEFDAARVGLPRRRIDELQASSLDDAVRIASEVLGGVSGPCAELAVLNAGAALWVGGAVGSIAEGMMLSTSAIASGHALGTLRRLAEITGESAA